MELLAGKTVLVTGGTGLVGSHLVAALIKERARTVVPFRSLDPRSYFATQKLAGSALMCVADIKDPARVFDIVTKYSVDYIIHLAAQAVVTVAYDNPVETVTTNILGTLNVLEAARRARTVTGIILASSDKAYGKRSTIVREQDPVGGDHPYEVAKSSADLIAAAYAKTYRLPLVITRFGNIYGPGDLQFSRIVPSIMRSAVTGETLEVRSDGTFIRDYVYVGDVVSGYLFLLKRLKEFKGGIFNLSSEDNLSVLALINRAQKILRKKISYTIANTQINEIPRQHVDWSKIKKLGWRPKYSLNRGLTTTYRWYFRRRKELFLS